MNEKDKKDHPIFTALHKFVEDILKWKILFYLVIAAMLALAVYRYSAFIYGINISLQTKDNVVATGKTKADGGSESKEQKAATPRIEVENLWISPVRFSIPSYMLVELKNNGTAADRDLNIVVDAGGSQIRDFEVRSYRTYAVLDGGKGKSFLNINASEINQGERIYIYLLLSDPSFKEIIWRSARSHGVYTFGSDWPSNGGNDWFVPKTLLRVLASLIAFALFCGVIYFLVKLFDSMSNWFFPGPKKTGAVEKK
jgi:hypothetical protein